MAAANLVIDNEVYSGSGANLPGTVAGWQVVTAGSGSEGLSRRPSSPMLSSQT